MWVAAWVICLVLAMDYVGMASGRPSILQFVNLTTGPLSLLGFFGLTILCGMALLQMVVLKRWSILLVLIGVFAGSAGVAMLVAGKLNEKSIAEAIAIAGSFADGSANLPIEWAENVPIDREVLLSRTTKKSIKLKFGSPSKHRYDFELQVAGRSPLVLTVYNASTQPRLWIHN